MPDDQASYDSGYEDGRRSRDEEIANLWRQYEWARSDLARAQEEAQRLRAIVHRERGGSGVAPL